MLHLLEIPTDYWARFISVESTDSDSQMMSQYSYFGEFNDTHISIARNISAVFICVYLNH